MAYRHSDMPDVFMALESVLGPDTGINGFAWQVSSVSGVGPSSNRVYYVICEQFTTYATVNGVPNTVVYQPTYTGKPFVLVIVTLVPGIPRHSAVLQATGLANATMDGALTSAAAAILASGLNESAQTTQGVALATNV